MSFDAKPIEKFFVELDSQTGPVRDANEAIHGLDPELERRFKKQEKEREERQKRAREKREREQIECELEYGFGGFDTREGGTVATKTSTTNPEWMQAREAVVVTVGARAPVYQTVIVRDRHTGKLAEVPLSDS